MSQDTSTSFFNDLRVCLLRCQRSAGALRDKRRNIGLSDLLSRGSTHWPLAPCRPIAASNTGNGHLVRHQRAGAWLRAYRGRWCCVVLKSVWLRRFAAAWLGLLASIALVNAPANAVVEWHRQRPPLSTPWTHLVGPNNALPEYPRPQMARTRWMNLNGVWGYTGRSEQAASAAPPPANEYREQILVPYPTESALSGIQRHDDQMWYRKVFKLPSNWRGQHVLLHFGAVDQIATVWVNNQQVAYHEGGYTEFSADITSALRPRIAQELTVRVEDRNEDNPSPSASSATVRRGCSTPERRASGRRCGWSRYAPRTSTSSTSPRT